MIFFVLQLLVNFFHISLQSHPPHLIFRGMQYHSHQDCLEISNGMVLGDHNVFLGDNNSIFGHNNLIFGNKNRLHGFRNKAIGDDNLCLESKLHPPSEEYNSSSEEEELDTTEEKKNTTPEEKKNTTTEEKKQPPRERRRRTETTSPPREQKRSRTQGPALILPTFSLQQVLSQHNLQICQTKLKGVVREAVGTEPNCAVCYTNYANVIYIPCGHVALCVSCGKQVLSLKCPICNQVSTHFQDVYFS